MSATYGDLMGTARLQIVRAQARLRMAQIDPLAHPTPRGLTIEHLDSAVEQTRALARTADQQVRTILGHRRLQLTGLLQLAQRGAPTTVLPAESAYVDAMDALLASDTEPPEPVGAPAVAIDRARTALGGASDLLRTHDTSTRAWTPAPPVALGGFDGSAIIPLGVLHKCTELAAQLSIRAHQLLGHDPDHWVHASVRGLEALSDPVMTFGLHLTGKRHADLSGVRTANPPIDRSNIDTHLRDLVTRLSVRAREAMARGPLPVHTVKDLYGVAGALHWGSGAAHDINPYIEAASELATYQSVIPPDRDVRADAKEIVSLIRPAMRDPKYAERLKGACLAAAPPLMFVLAEVQAASSGAVDAWSVRERNYASVIKQWGPAATRVEVALTSPAPLAVPAT